MLTMLATLALFCLLASVVGELKVGMMGPELVTDLIPYVANITKDGVCMPSFECDILKAVCEALKEECTIVFLYDFQDRMNKVASGEVDLTIAQTKVTPENAESVHFVRPFYYYAGAGISVSEDLPTKDHPTWEDIQGQRVCHGEGFYAAQAIKFRYDVELVEVNLEEFVASGMTPSMVFEQFDCSFILTDNTNVIPEIVQSVNALVEFGSPQGIAVAHEKRDTLGEDISKALINLMNKGKDSAILDIEKRTFGSVGIPGNIKLRDIVQAITDFNGSLPAAVEDAIWDE